MIGFGFILAFVGVIFFIAGVAQAIKNRAFLGAQTATGTVTRKHSRNQKVGYSYWLVLSYSVDGIAYERELGVSPSEYDDVEVGGQYEVLYRPDKPKKIMRPQDANPKNVKIVLLIGAAMLVAGVGLLFGIRLANM